MIRSFLKNKDFRDKYFLLLISRLTSASIRFEVDSDAANAENALMYASNIEAMEYLFNAEYDKIRPDIIQEVAHKVNGDDLPYGFRKTNIIVNGSNVPRTEAREIYYHIYSLIDNYYNVWNELDPFTREAFFHIYLLRIHPFEDGNGRTARILTACNLIKSGIAPAIITPDIKEKYNNCIEYFDVDTLASMLSELSQVEEVIVKQLYSKYDPEDFSKKFKPSN